MRFEIEKHCVGERLDKCLAREVSLARNKIQGLIRTGAVLLNGKPTTASQTLRQGDAVEFIETVSATSDDGPLIAEPWQDSIGVLEESSDFLVLNKPAGLVVHPGAGNSHGTLANFLVGRWPEIATIGSAQRPGIVHRLDVGTTGVMLVARTEHSYAVLSQAFAERKIDKVYLAVVYGNVSDPIEIDLPIGRHPNDRRRMTVRRSGRPARSTVTPIARTADGNISLIAVRLHTGRTHQIRVHLKAAKFPLIGDPTYGEARWKEQVPRFRRALSTFARPALHAYRLGFNDPTDQRGRSYSASVPGDLSELWHSLSIGESATRLVDLVKILPTPQIGS